MALWKARLTIAALAAVALFSASAAKAQTCESLPNPIFVAGSTASQPVWTHVGPILFDAGVTVVYQNQGSCTGVTAIESNVPGSPSVTGVAGTAIYFPGTSADGGTVACTITPASGTQEAVDVGVSDVFEETCDAVNQVSFPVSGVSNFSGPTQLMEFLQPRVASVSVHEIAAEQAFYVLGFGPNGGGVAPWNQPTENNTVKGGTGFLPMRNAQSGTQSMIAGAIALPPALFQVIDEGGTGGVVSVLTAVVTGSLPNPASYMGIAVAGSYDTQRAKLQALAFRGYGQRYAWLPDSSDATFDKRNVREGLYTIFGPLQFLFNVDNSGAKTDPKATTLINYLNGTTPIPGTTITDAEIAASTIPDCAMGVTRPDNNWYSIVPNHRQHSCDCYFESKVTASTVTCKVCSGAVDCPGGYCSPQGVCEAF